MAVPMGVFSTCLREGGFRGGPHTIESKDALQECSAYPRLSYNLHFVIKLHPTPSAPLGVPKVTLGRW